MSDKEKKITAIRARAAELITFRDALKQCANLLVSAPALLYTPQWCGFAQFDAVGRLVAADGKPAEEFVDKPDDFRESVFEARVFNQQVELRWLHKRNGEGRAVLLSDDGEDAKLDDYFAELPQLTELPKLDKIIETIPQTYLLWGEGIEVTEKDRPAPGWSRLTTARIGRLHVPLAENDVGTGRVQLVAREYLGEVDQHGNVAVVEERLLKLEVAK